MRILIVDPLSFYGHVNYNYGIIDAISEKYECDVIVNEYQCEQLINKGINSNKFLKVYPNKWNIAELSKKYNKILYHILYRYYFLKIVYCAIKQKNNYDFVLFTSIEITSFVLLSMFFNEKTAIVDHNIGKIKKSNLYNLSWRLCNNKIKIVVLEDFIRDMVLSEIPTKKVFVVHHPLPSQTMIYTNLPKDDKIVVFAPSNSNDEGILEQVVKEKMSSKIFVYAKSHKLRYKTKNIEISPDFISNEMYSELMGKADFILLPYESSYNYRISAVLFEAIVRNKKVILLNNNTLSFYKDIFPQNIILIDNSDFISEIVNGNLYKCFIDNSSLDKYKKESLVSQFSSIIS